MKFQSTLCWYAARCPCLMIFLFVAPPTFYIQLHLRFRLRIYHAPIARLYQTEIWCGVDVNLKWSNYLAKLWTQILFLLILKDVTPPIFVQLHCIRYSDNNRLSPVIANVRYTVVSIGLIISHSLILTTQVNPFKYGFWIS